MLWKGRNFVDDEKLNENTKKWIFNARICVHVILLVWHFCTLVTNHELPFNFLLRLLSPSINLCNKIATIFRSWNYLFFALIYSCSYMGQKEGKSGRIYTSKKRNSLAHIAQKNSPENTMTTSINCHIISLFSFFSSETTHFGNKNGPFIERTTNNCFMITFNISPNTQKCSKQYCFLNEIITLCFVISIRRTPYHPKTEQINWPNRLLSHTHTHTQKKFILQIHVRELSNWFERQKGSEMSKQANMREWVKGNELKNMSAHTKKKSHTRTHIHECA